MAEISKFHKQISKYITHYLPLIRNMSPRTIDTYRDSLRIYIEWVADSLDLKYERINEEHFTLQKVSDFIEHLQARGCSAKTINVRLSALKSFAKFCYREDLAFAGMFAEINAVKMLIEPKSGTVKYLTKKELKLLLSMPDASTRTGYRDLAFMALTYWSGCRVSELLNLKLRDVTAQDDGSLVLYVWGKGNKGREVRIMLDGARLLKSYIKKFHSRSSNDAPLFYVYRQGEKAALTRSAAHKIIKKYVKMAVEHDPDFPAGTHMHTLRHSLAVHLHEHGTALVDIKEILGHSSLQSTTIYAKATPEVIKKKMTKMRGMVKDSVKKLKEGGKQSKEGDEEADFFSSIGLKKHQ